MSVNFTAEIIFRSSKPLANKWEVFGNEVCFPCAVKLAINGLNITAEISSSSIGACFAPGHPEEKEVEKPLEIVKRSVEDIPF